MDAVSELVGERQEVAHRAAIVHHDVRMGAGPRGMAGWPAHLALRGGGVVPPLPEERPASAADFGGRPSDGWRPAALGSSPPDFLAGPLGWGAGWSPVFSTSRPSQLA